MNPDQVKGEKSPASLWCDYSGEDIDPNGLDQSKFVTGEEGNEKLEEQQDYYVSHVLERLVSMLVSESQVEGQVDPEEVNQVIEPS